MSISVCLLMSLCWEHWFSLLLSSGYFVNKCTWKSWEFETRAALENLLLQKYVCVGELVSFE